MTDPVSFLARGRIAIAVIDNPPVNALSHGVRAGLVEALARTAADPALEALVILCRGRTFCAGADVREFGRPFKDPQLGEVVARTEASAKPVIAALHGTALGGGLELALACHFRLAAPSTRLGLPEVKLGIIPGAAGTQRLPRLVPVRAALTMIAEGKDVSATEALKLGLVDAVVEGDLEQAAFDFAEAVLTERRPLRRTGELTPVLDDPGAFDEFTKSLAKKQRGFLAPLEAVKAVRLAYELPFPEGIRRENAMCMELLNGAQSKAQRHAFAIERDIARVPGLPADTPVRAIGRCAVVGSGVMGRGIAVCFANAGIPVTILAHRAESGAAALAAIGKIYAGLVGRGSLAQAEADRRLALITSTLDYPDLKNADLVVEAVAEDLSAKQAVFAQLGAVARAGAILSSNTSFLDLNALGQASGRPADVAGMHFFNPAQTMRLLELVRTPASSPEVVATLMKLGKLLGKVAVTVGAGEGFVANRMLSRRSREALFMLEEGAEPSQIDRVLTDFGFPLGPLAVQDLGGLDVVLATRRARFAQLSPRERSADLLEQLTAAGRLGQKNGKGWYRYDAERRPSPDPEVAQLIARHAAARGIAQRTLADAEVLERCLYAMINEGARLIEAGLVARPHEIDVIWLHGFGFPAYRGGPMYYADQVGLPTVHERLLHYAAQVGPEYFTPAPLLARLAGEGRGFYEPG
ncbi:MAG: enoyl-CoA hydratase/isomerase family protein [Proteobacteria bacterium]|nr:enoyl-CoA hydratase/isomerase family protein [Pseudomonadota bacterium]